LRLPDRNEENTVWTRLEDTEGVGGTERWSYKEGDNQDLKLNLLGTHGVRD
jgi:hypothetical protein